MTLSVKKFRKNRLQAGAVHYPNPMISTPFSTNMSSVRNKQRKFSRLLYITIIRDWNKKLSGHPMLSLPRVMFYSLDLPGVVRPYLLKPWRGYSTFLSLLLMQQH